MLKTTSALLAAYFDRWSSTWRSCARKRLV